MESDGDMAQPPTGSSSRILWRVRLNWKLIFAIILPIVLLPLIFIEDDEFIESDDMDPDASPIKSTKFRAAYAILIIALFWMFEIMPLPVTALLPLVLFPLLGVLGTDQVAPLYLAEPMLIGGFGLGLAVEYCNLHMRIALKVMNVVGSSPIPLLFGVMSTSAFLSMWMSNTACTAMMLPIMTAVMDQVSDAHNTEANPEVNDSNPNSHDKEKSRRNNLRKMYMLGVAYASNLGGTATITGTGANLVFQGIVKEFDISQGGKYADITFANWMALNVPAAIINILMTFVYLVFVFYGLPNWRQLPVISKICFRNRKQMTKEDIEREEEERKKVDGANKLLQMEYEKLGPMNFHEASILVIFVTVVLAWILRKPKFMRGWDDLLQDANNTDVEVGDASAAILGTVAMLLLPRDLIFFTGTPKQGQSYKPLLDWKFVERNMSWGVIFLMGGGFALSDGAIKSGLSQWLGEQLTGLDNLPRPVMLLIVMVLCACVTEFCSNVATANIIVPILLTLSRQIDIHPLYLAMPATISCSFAFMFPIATPPNALVFSAGNLRIIDMVKTGAFLNVSCIILYFLVHISLGQLLFNYSSYEYVDKTNAT